MADKKSARLELRIQEKLKDRLTKAATDSGLSQTEITERAIKAELKAMRTAGLIR